MKHLLLSTIALIFLVPTLEAQDDKRYGGSGSFNLGIQTMDVEPINDIISRYGYEDLSNTNISIGGGGQFYLGSWVISGEGGFIGQDDVQNDSYTLRFGAGYGMFSIGYGIVDKERFFLYPSIGGGFYGTGLQLSQRNESASFEDLFAEPSANEDRTISTGAFTGAGEVALNADFWLSSKDGNAYGLMLGLSAGYRFSGSAEFENIAGSELANSPDFNPGGAFVTLRVGGGFRGSKEALKNR
jgi:hypothetical protein